MIQSNYYEDNLDLQFIQKHFINWDEIVPLKEQGFEDAQKYAKLNDARFEFAPSNVQEAVDSYVIALAAAGEIAGKELAPVAKKMEEIGLTFKDGKVTFPEDFPRIVKLLADGGILGYSVDRDFGGLRMPLSAQIAITEVMSRADAAFGITIGCYNLAEVIERFGDEEMKKNYVQQMVNGEIIGAMALTEPNYGSDLSNILTKAEKQEDGTYLISGTKRFITHGCGLADTPSAILTLARSGRSGARGLSFFLVDGKDIEVARIEHKLGLHISPTCEIVYDKSKAVLIGEEGKGLVKYAMEMMNGARLGIAIQALGIGHAAYEESKLYASQRVQFGKSIDQIPAVARQLNEMEAFVHAMRALTYKTAEIVDLYDGYTIDRKKQGMDDRSVRIDPKVQKWSRLASLFTPLAKYFCSEIANKVAYEALQIYGGSGYTEEYDVAKIYRDARITTIYEGTSNLQVVAAIGALVEGYRKDGISYEFVMEQVQALGDSKDKTLLTKLANDLLKDMEEYKAQDKTFRDAYAYEAVNSFTALISYALLASQLETANKVGNTEVANVKERVLNTYRLYAARTVSAAGLSLRGV